MGLIPCTTACPAYFKDNLGQLRTTLFLCVGGTSLEEGGKVVPCCPMLSSITRGFSSHARLRAQRSDDCRKDGDDNLDDAFQCKSFHGC